MTASNRGLTGLRYLVLSFVLAFGTSANLCAEDLVIAVALDMPPFVMDKGHSGIEIDIMRAALDYSGHTFQTRQHSYRQLADAVTEKGVDAAATVLKKDDGTYYSDNYVKFENFAFTRKSAGIKIDRIADLKDKSIVAWENAYEDLGLEFQKLFSPTVKQPYRTKYREITDQAQQVEMFWKNEAEVIVIDKSILRWVTKKLAGQVDTSEELVRHDIFAKETQFRISFKNERIRDDFNRGLTHLRQQGVYRKIYDKYLAANTTRASENDAQAKDIEEALVELSLAFKDRDVAVIKRLTTPDHIAITSFYGEPQAIAEEIDSLPDLKLTEYTEGKMNVSFLSKDVVLFTYPLQLKGTFKGKELFSKNYASSVWVKRGGKWAEAFYQETPLVGAHSPTLKPKYMQTTQVMALVKKAAALVERKGEEAFPEFKKSGSDYFHGDFYVFVDDLKGKILCSPITPELEGTNILDLTDADGKRFMAGVADIVAGEKAAGWVHYRWLRRKSQDPSWKSSYVVRVQDASGRQYLVGSGLYDMKVEKLFIVDTVDDAARLIKKKGEQAFATLRDRTGPFRYQDVYVFVDDYNGIELVNPVSPELEGTDLIDFKDANGKLVIREMIEMLRDKDSGWMEYMWPKPGATTPSKKMSYVRKLHGGEKTLYVGAGVYLENE
jgi:ABC-type amino acid transport substrate-binding protein